MKKKIKSAVISIAVIAVLLLSILIGVKNGTLDKLTKEMPTLETKQEETKKSAENESQKNESSNSVRIRNSSRRDIANVGQQFELRNNDVKYTYDENNRETYNVFYINYICLFDYLFISSQMSAKPYFIGSTGILLLW